MTRDNAHIARFARRAGAKWSHYPADVIPAWVADMDFDVAQPIIDAIAEQLEISDLGYPVGARDAGLPALFAERVRERFDWTIDTRQVEVFNDVVQGIYASVTVLSEPGDGVVIHTPIYPPFLHAVAETGRRGVLCPLTAGSARYEIDFDRMAREIDAQTRVLLLCHPHNPCGRAFDRAELEQIAEFALHCGLYVVSDEIHADLMLDERRHIPFASIDPAVAARTVTFMSASKAFNIAGLCMAFGVFGSSEVRQQFKKIPRHLRGGTNTLSMTAVRAAWTSAQGWQDEVIARLRANRDYLAAYVARHWPLVGHIPPEATYLAWLDFRQLELAGGPHEYFLAQARVALSDGMTFGEPGRGFARLNFATSPEVLEAILSRMSAALER